MLMVTVLSLLLIRTGISAPNTHFEVLPRNEVGVECEIECSNNGTITSLIYVLHNASSLADQVEFACTSSTGEISFQPLSYNGDVSRCTSGFVRLLKVINELNYKQVRILSDITMSDKLAVSPLRVVDNKSEKLTRFKRGRQPKKIDEKQNIINQKVKEIEIMKKELTEKNTTIDQLNQNLVNNQYEIDQKQNQIQTLHKKLKYKSFTVDEFDHELGNREMEVSVLRTDLKKLQLQIEHLVQESLAQQDSINDLSKKLSSSEEENNKNIKIKEHIQENLKPILNENVNLEKDIENYKIKIKKQENEISKINKKLEQNNQKLAKLVDLNDELNHYVTRFAEMIEQLKKTNYAVNQKDKKMYEDLKGEKEKLIEENKQKIVEIKNEKNKLEKDKLKLISKNEELSQSNEELVKRLDNNNNKINNLNTKYQLFDKDKEHLVNKILDLEFTKNQYEELKKTVRFRF